MTKHLHKTLYRAHPTLWGRKKRGGKHWVWARAQTLTGGEGAILWYRSRQEAKEYQEKGDRICRLPKDATEKDVTPGFIFIH